MKIKCVMHQDPDHSLFHRFFRCSLWLCMRKNFVKNGKRLCFTFFMSNLCSLSQN